MGVATGADTRVNLQFEESGNYTTLDSSRSPFVPGGSGSLDTAQAANRIVRITNFSKDVAVALEESNFEGAFAMSWVLTNPWWLEGIFGSPTTVDNSDGSWTHTYSLGSPLPFYIFEGYETSTTAERELKGCVPRGVQLQPEVGEDGGTRVTMDGFYATEETNTSVTLTSQDGLDDDVLDYADATLKRDGSAEALVQSATLSYGWRTAEPIYTFGQRTATDFVAGLLTPTLEYAKLKQDAATLQDVYGGASATTVQGDVTNKVSCELAWDNGAAAGSGINKHVYSLSTTAPASYDDGGFSPASAITEQLNRTVTDVTVDVTNETSAAP